MSESPGTQAALRALADRAEQLSVDTPADWTVQASAGPPDDLPVLTAIEYPHTIRHADPSAARIRWQRSGFVEDARTAAGWHLSYARMATAAACRILYEGTAPDGVVETDELDRRTRYASAEWLSAGVDIERRTGRQCRISRTRLLAADSYAMSTTYLAQVRNGSRRGHDVLALTELDGEVMHLFRTHIPANDATYVAANDALGASATNILVGALSGFYGRRSDLDDMLRKLSASRRHDGPDDINGILEAVANKSHRRNALVHISQQLGARSLQAAYVRQLARIVRPPDEPSR